LREQRARDGDALTLAPAAQQKGAGRGVKPYVSIHLPMGLGLTLSIHPSIYLSTYPSISLVLAPAIQKGGRGEK